MIELLRDWDTYYCLGMFHSCLALLSAELCITSVSPNETDFSVMLCL